ncbi:uncharacterized protein LOC113044105 isoform X1 [Carassius auratus]|uniref:Uncharacterized protein LOC113044105 isoform X1 n=1 Tax=Carassius auratus TaxID=7957 RepID=A0A6P6JJ33_CARAU|nr:uncharacterized protein LOC113044105 isoform X1 [Carassius auratus]
MATQCRSSRCTAERKGFRRELDSWRHKLIHCVGFESILEGIYGPRLLQDLSIFVECEPEAVDDWSMNANCSFCNLQLEKLNDQPAVAVPGSPPPAETPPPQGLSTSEKPQCQADQFLNAIFRKKEFPQSCDSSVPLVAQELMRKMIRRFALEYACKSQAHEGLNGLSETSELLPNQPDRDGPLDLTISRASQALQVDGVLDLSKKNTSAENETTQRMFSGSLGPSVEDRSRLEKEGGSKAPVVWRVTVLEKVLSSLCSHHRLLLCHILKDMQEDYNISVTLRDAHRRQFTAGSLSCHADKKSLNEAPILTLSDCSVTAGICCRKACRLPTIAFSPLCVCLRNIHSNACQNTSMASVGQDICSNPTVCCAHSKLPSCQLQHNGDHNYISLVKETLITHQCDCNSHNRCHKGSRSPSPPPLSPKPVDLDCKIAVKSSILQIQDCKSLNMAPPPLLPHRTEDEDTALYSNTPLHVGSPDECCEKVALLPTQAEKENDHHCGSFLDLIDRVTEKFRSIQPSEKEQNLLAHASQISKTDDTHLTEIITTVLHNSSDKDYNLNELLQQHVATEQRSPQTRSRKRLETLVAMSKSPDLPSSRRQSLQIKRDLARLSQTSYFKRNIGFERDGSLKTGKAAQVTYSLVEQSDCRKLGRIPKAGDSKPVKDTLENLTTYAQTKETPNKQKRQETQPQLVSLEETMPLDDRAQLQTTISDRKVKAKAHKEKNLTIQVGRARRNIVPPQRFSSYVTEPRKMYFAACFSESIFTKHSLKDISSTALGSTEEIAWPNDICDKHPFQTDDKREDCDVPQNVTSSKNLISSKKEQPCEHKDNGRNPDKESARKRKPCQNSTSPSKRSKRHMTNSLNTDSQNPTETMSNFTTTESGQEDKTSLSGLKYESPIKLMFVSSVTGEDGVKYTLKAAASGSNSDGEMFDPCVDSSWSGSAIDEHFQDTVLESVSGRTVEHGGNKYTSTKVVSCDAVLPSCSNNEDEIQETLPIVHETSPVKRRPGRPKKIGPHIVKSVKRPIGRPPKPKITDFCPSTGTTGSSAVNHRTTEMSCKDNRNKNLKITIANGRSRRAKRVVSEDLSNIPEHQHVFELLNGGTHSEICSRKNSSNDELLKDHHFVMPIEERKFVSSGSNIKCQRQSDIAVSRKPGRPPKVKISGISVTVTTGSPRQRKIHIKRDTNDSHLRRKTLIEFQPSKDQKTICIPTDIHKDVVDAPKEHSQNTRGQFVPVRHSVRERKPSIHLLHSVATARSCALVRRSRKLLLNKVSCESSQNTKNNQEQGELPKNALSTRTKNVSCIQDVRFSTISMDSIFSSNEGFRWWPTLASPETLNEELARRIKLMSNTWVSDVGYQANKSEEIKSDFKSKTCEKLRGSAKKSASAIKMLFEGNCNMEKLCTWFMQSTETQSLAIVKKTTEKNPKDVFHYNLSRPNCKGNVCPSPQAERLRKHVKKFAKVVPKSPSMHKQAQEMLSKSTRLQAKRKLFNTSSFKQRHDVRHRMSRSRSTWVVYRTALLRARLKFKTKPRTTLGGDMAHKVFGDQMSTRTSGAETPELWKEMPNLVGRTSRPVTKVQNALNLLVKTPQKIIGIADISKQNRISSKAWSPESLKQCRVFLKKINSPNTKSATEECNICTVKLYDVSHQEENEDVLVGGTPPSTVNLPIQLHSSPKSQRKGGGKRGKQKSWSTSPSSPTKMLRQSRSSRGVLGARWCDFVLGSLK